MDVNSIQHILACCNDISSLRLKLNELARASDVIQQQLDDYWLKYGVANRFDNAETIYVKRLLQHVLPENIRNKITTTLFKYYVGISQAEFSNQLYMSTAEVADLVSKGMYVGSHGSKHYWLDQINENEQRKDISESLDFLEEVGAETKDWIMCYPYGAYNETTLSLLKDFGAALGITTELRIANISEDNPLTLPRLDTNDFPK